MRYFAAASEVRLRRSACFWHSFDLAYTSFSSKPVLLHTDATPVDQDAYSHEVVSFDFWPGDPSLPQAAFYSYTAPMSDRLAEQPLSPEKAYWGIMRGSPIALLNDDDFRVSATPWQTLLDFLESAYLAGTTLSH